MEDKDLELYLNKARATDESITSFSETIGNTPVVWEKNDVITFPPTIKGNSFKRKFNGKKLEYIVVTVKKADGTERPGDFFPSLFRKRARKCDWETIDGVKNVIAGWLTVIPFALKNHYLDIKVGVKGYTHLRYLFIFIKFQA
mgnify:CR=1 FL=1